ncbi:MAG: secretin N-terminal domain-containing protein [Verrucomicrobiota bacterium JB023]|nr:secretin N-terminal domain-containing protein [Verrucomicrobiota bacterium JB023]
MRSQHTIRILATMLSLVALNAPAQEPGALPPADTETLPPFEDYLPESEGGLTELPPADPNEVIPDLPVEELPEVQPDIEESGNGFLLTDASLNDVFALLAEEANRQFFHNPRLAGDEFRVTGRLIPGNALNKMDELAFQYGLEIYEKGNTVYALTKDQLVDLPSKEWHYSLRYLRPTDIEMIKNLVQPYLSPGTGIVNYEPKTNTLIVIDTPNRIEKVQSFFQKIDKPAGQIVLEVKILSVNSDASSRLGSDWSNTLGSLGLTNSALVNLNSLFGIDVGSSGSDSSGGNFVLDDVTLSSVLRALNEGGMVEQKSNPVVITEDNEQAVISLIDRVPIITTTVTNSTGVSNLTEEVRYKIDESDPAGDPETTREIGITIAITPQILQDGTIRMKMRPRSAQVVDQILGASGNYYPRVSESTIETIARIPDGHSMLVGGFYGEAKTNGGTKVPILGDIPGLNFFFKSKETTKEHSSLIFVVTPKSYSPENHADNYREYARVQRNHSLPVGHDWVNHDAPGRAHEADYCRTLNAINQDLRRETYLEPKPISRFEVDVRETQVSGR